MIFTECLTDPLQQQMYAYWRGKRGGRRMPSRADIDPTEIPRLLPNLLISERRIDTGRERWRYRLAGTAVVAAFGMDPTGRYLDDILTGNYRDFIEKIHRVVREEGRALYCESESTISHGLPISPRRLLLPLAKDGERVDQIISLLVFRRDTVLPLVIELNRTEGTTRHAGPILAEA